MFILTESKLNNAIPSHLISLPGYHEPLRRDRNRNGGGVLIYIAEHLSFKPYKGKLSESEKKLFVNRNKHKMVYSFKFSSKRYLEFLLC